MICISSFSQDTWTRRGSYSTMVLAHIDQLHPFMSIKGMCLCKLAGDWIARQSRSMLALCRPLRRACNPDRQAWLLKIPKTMNESVVACQFHRKKDPSLQGSFCAGGGKGFRDVRHPGGMLYTAGPGSPWSLSGAVMDERSRSAAVSLCSPGSARVFDPAENVKQLTA
jgi:hypothetical protein